MDPKVYRISELAEKAGVSKRTIHYYISRGLLPPPSGEGLASAYGDAHLLRLRYIKRQQEAFLPLDEIRRRLNALSDEEVGRAVEADGGQAPAGSAAVGDVGIPEPPAGGRASGPAHYERVELGLGLELHIPLGNRRAEKIAESIIGYAKKLVKEG